MRQRAQVVKTDGSKAWVRVADPAEACGKCQGCIRLTPEQKQGDSVYEVENMADAREGEWVILDQSTRELVKAIIVLYGVPLAGLFLGYGIAHLILESDGLAGLGAMAGFLVSIVVARPIARRLAAGARQPQIVSISCSETAVG